MNDVALNTIVGFETDIAVMSAVVVPAVLANTYLSASVPPSSMLYETSLFSPALAVLNDAVIFTVTSSPSSLSVWYDETVASLVPSYSLFATTILLTVSTRLKMAV